MECHNCGGDPPATDEGAYTDDHGRICDSCWNEIKDEIIEQRRERRGRR